MGNIRPVLAFILGVALASGVAYFAVSKRSQTPAAIGTVSQNPAPVQTQPVSAPNPAPAAVPPEEPSKPPVEATVAQETPAKITRRNVVVARHSAMGAASRASDDSDWRHSAAAPAMKQPVQVAQAAPPQQVPEPVQAAPVPVPEPAPQREQQAPVVQEQRQPEPPEPHSVTLPSGTTILVRLDETLSTERSYQGDAFRATLTQPLVVEGFVIAERGARASGRIVELDKGGKVQGLARIGLELTSVTTSDGQKVGIRTEHFVKDAQNTHARDAAKIGGGAALGAIIGAIAGGGKGAAIGAGVGGAAGGADVAMTRGRAAELPAETKITFRVTDPVTITERLAQ